MLHVVYGGINKILCDLFQRVHTDFIEYYNSLSTVTSYVITLCGKPITTTADMATIKLNLF